MKDTQGKKELPEKIWIAGNGFVTGAGSAQGFYWVVQPKYGDHPCYVPESLVREARAKAFEEAAKEVDAWRDLIEIDHRDILAKSQYSNPQEASREYRNKQNLLGSVAHGIRDKARAGRESGEERK